MDLLCSHDSLQHDEPLHGSAKAKISRWLLLEYCEQWAPNILDSPMLPPEVKEHLENFQDAHPETALLFIRKEKKAWPRRLMALSIAEDKTLKSEVFLNSWEEFLALSLDGLFREKQGPMEKPLALVCTHGRRDLCCAMNGVAVYQALEDAFSESQDALVYQASHVGGHRFSANMLLFPCAYFYGRVEANEAIEILRSYKKGQLLSLDKLRGRSLYPKAVQTAAIHLRQALRLSGLRDLLWLPDQGGDFHEREPKICFQVEPQKGRYEVSLRESEGLFLITSCGGEPSQVKHYEPLSIRELQA